jgi:hypothetical protein
MILAVTIALGLSALVPALMTSGSHASASSSHEPGLWLVGSDGGVFSYGAAGFDGSTAGRSLNKPIAGMAATSNGHGYWLAASDGGIFNYGNARFYGSTGGLRLNKSIVAVAATPNGKGYWLTASDGGIFTFGDAGFYGSTGAWHLNQPITAMAATPDGKGYWLVAADGGIFNYGDAGFYGSTAQIRLVSPITAVATTPNGKGYWLVAANGAVYAYGDAAYYGSGVGPNMSVVAAAATSDGQGYWLVTSNGAVFPYGDATALGSTAGMSLNRPVVGAAAVSMLTSSTLPATTTTQPPAATTTTQPPATTTTTTRPPTTTTTTRPPTTTTTTVPPTTTTTTTQPSSPSGALAAPAGYTASQKFFDDTFSGTSLDTSNWTSELAPGSNWNDESMPSGDSSAGTNQAAYWAPSQATVDNGLTLSARQTTSADAGYAKGFKWVSGVVTSKFTLPTTGWYVQVSAKMPDTSDGMWPALWFLPSSSAQEFDGFEGGWAGGSANTQGHSDLFDSSGQVQQVWSTPSSTNITSGFNTYGFQYIPGQSVTAYFNGKQVYQDSDTNISSQAYYLLIQLQVAASPTSGWHTALSASTPTPSNMDIAEVQAYSAP